jgi:S1-C subfamily serine protease
MGKRLIAAVLVGAWLISQPGVAAAQSSTPAELTPADDRLGVLLTDRAAHVDPGYGTLEGALIAEVVPGSPAYRAGLKVRDIILKIDGVHLHDARQLRNRIALLRAGRSADIEVERNGQRQTITVMIGSHS